jgi:hypothetical protein
MNVKFARWTTGIVLLICGLSLCAQPAAPAHASPAMLALCADEPNLPPALRARFCPVNSTGAKNEPLSKKLGRNGRDGAPGVSTAPAQ